MPADLTNLPTVAYLPIRRSTGAIARRTIGMTLVSIVLILTILTLDASSTAASASTVKAFPFRGTCAVGSSLLGPSRAVFALRSSAGASTTSGCV